MRTFDTTTTNKINAEVSPDHWRFFGRSFANSSVTFSYDETRILSMDFSGSSTTGARYEIGTAIAPTMRVVLENSDGALNSFNAQTEWEVHGYFKYDNATEYDALDTAFIINNITYENSKVTFDCIGAIVLFDVVADESYFNFGSDSANTIVDKICTKVGHGFARSTNFVGEFSKPLSENYTYRDMLRWTGVQNNCSIGVSATKKIKNMIATNTGVTLPNSYFKFNLGKNTIAPKGVRVFSFDGSIYGEHKVGDGKPTMCVRNLDMCPQTTTFLSDVAETIYSHYSFARTPFSATITRNPRFEVNDIVTVRDLNGNTHTTVITGISFSASGNMSIECCDEEDDLLNSGITTKISAVKNAVVEVERTAEGLTTTVSQVSQRVTNAESDIDTLETGVSGLTSRMTTAESNITQNTTAINLRATKTEFDQYKSEMQTKSVQLVTNGALSMGNKTNFSDSHFTFVPGGINGSGGCVSTSFQGALFSDEHFPIDTNLEYEVSCDAKGTTGSGRFYFGLCCYDVDKKIINSDHCMFINGTTTKLARQLKNGDTKIYLEDVSEWIDTPNNYQRGVSIWDYSNSHGFRYPKETYTQNAYRNLWTNYSQIDKVNNVITLDSAWTGGTHEQGEWISQHSAGGQYKYVASTNLIVPTSWTHFSGVIKGIDEHGGNDAHKFFPYTVFARVLILSNYPSGSGDTQYYTNMFVRPAYQKQIDSLSAELTVQAGQISSKVSQTEYNGQTIASKINQSASTVQIEAQHIDINGVISANNTFKVDTNGNLTATGGKIGGWSINLSSILKEITKDGSTYRVSLNAPDTIDLSLNPAIYVLKRTGSTDEYPLRIFYNGRVETNDIRANGGSIGGWTISNGKLTTTVSNVYLPYTEKDIKIVKDIMAERISPTTYAYTVYDFDRNGVIDFADLQWIVFMVKGQLTIEQCEAANPGFTRPLNTVTIEINPTSGTETIKMTSDSGIRDVNSLYGISKSKNSVVDTYGVNSDIVKTADIEVNGISPLTTNNVSSSDSRVVIDSGSFVQFGKMVTAMVRFHTTSNTTGNVNITASFPNPIFSIGVVGYNGNTGNNDGLNYWFNGTLYTTSSLTANVPHNICFSYLTN